MCVCMWLYVYISIYYVYIYGKIYPYIYMFNHIYMCIYIYKLNITNNMRIYIYTYVWMCCIYLDTNTLCMYKYIYIYSVIYIFICLWIIYKFNTHVILAFVIYMFIAAAWCKQTRQLLKPFYMATNGSPMMIFRPRCGPNAAFHIKLRDSGSVSIICYICLRFLVQ